MNEDQQTAWHAEGDPEKGTVKLTGEIDFTNSPEVRQWLKDFSAGLTTDMQVDLAELTYIDSSGLAVLIEARKLLQTMNRSIRVTAVSDQVRKIFSLTQIGELFGL